MSALTTIRRLRLALVEADAPTALPSWAHVRHATSPRALAAAEEALALLTHHARAFPTPGPYDTPVVAHARTLLTAPIR